MLRAIELYDGRPLTRQSIKLMALTFVRTSELIEARWDEFDFDARRWCIPAERMKMKTPHIVPLPISGHRNSRPVADDLRRPASWYSQGSRTFASPSRI